LNHLEIDSSLNHNRRPLCSIISAGCAAYGRREGTNGRDLIDEALGELFKNSPKLDMKDINAIYLGQGFESFEHEANTAATISNDYGFQNMPSTRIESVSASGGAALRQAVLAIMSGCFDVVICGGVEKMSNKKTEDALEIISMASNRPFEQWNGATLTSLNALAARVHMEKFGTTEEDLALVAVKNHKNAFENPKAFFHKLISVEDVMNSRPVSTPLKLLDCSPICDGAATIALCKPELAAKFAEVVIDVVGSSEASDTDFVFREEVTGFKATRIASKTAYEMSQISPREIDFAEVHDAFTINELVAYEDLGFCEKGKAAEMIESHSTAIDGKLPVNVSGGLKAKGHPVGSSGVGQVYEVFTQMRGLVESSRKVKDPKIALTHSMGGAGVTVQVHIFQRRA
jgi:acetyl-CoA C-acetyltransferase